MPPPDRVRGEAIEQSPFQGREGLWLRTEASGGLLEGGRGIATCLLRRALGGVVARVGCRCQAGCVFGVTQGIRSFVISNFFIFSEVSFLASAETVKPCHQGLTAALPGKQKQSCSSKPRALLLCIKAAGRFLGLFLWS